MSEDAIKNFHTDLRKSKGKFAVFLGAGSSYDYGIPTMDEMAQILRQQIIETVTKKSWKSRFFKNQNSSEYVMFSSPF